MFINVIHVGEYNGTLNSIHLCPTDGYRRIEINGGLVGNDKILDTGGDVFVEKQNVNFVAGEDKWIIGGRGIGLPITASPGEECRLVMFFEDGNKNKISGLWDVNITYRKRRSTI